MKEAAEIVVETCSKLVDHYAKKHDTLNTNVRIRIDMEKLGAKPVFGIFDESTIVERCTLKDIIRASGGGGFSMIIGVYIRNIIKDIFTQSLKEMKLSDSKQLYLLLFLDSLAKVSQPTIGLYRGKEFAWSLTIAEIMEASLDQTKK
jgi:hypothetical protein